VLVYQMSIQSNISIIMQDESTTMLNDHIELYSRLDEES